MPDSRAWMNSSTLGPIATEPTDVPIEPTDLREVSQDEAEQLVDEPVGDEAEE